MTGDTLTVTIFLITLVLGFGQYLIEKSGPKSRYAVPLLYVVCAVFALAIYGWGAVKVAMVAAADLPRWFVRPNTILGGFSILALMGAVIRYFLWRRYKTKPSTVMFLWAYYVEFLNAFCMIGFAVMTWKDPGFAAQVLLTNRVALTLIFATLGSVFLLRALVGASHSNIFIRIEQDE